MGWGWQWHRPRGSGDHPGQPRETLALEKNRAVHRPRHGGSYAVTMPTSLTLCRKVAVAPDSTPWCTAHTMAVNTVIGGDHLHCYCSKTGLGGHHPRGGGAIGQIVAAPLLGHQPTPLSRPPALHHHRGGGAPDRGWQCHPGSTSSLVSPPLL
jgi:hypothetical protein